MPRYFALGRSIFLKRGEAPSLRVARVERGTEAPEDLADLFASAPEARALIVQVAVALRQRSPTHLGNALQALDSFARQHYGLS